MQPAWESPVSSIKSLPAQKKLLRKSAPPCQGSRFLAGFRFLFQYIKRPFPELFFRKGAVLHPIPASFRASGGVPQNAPAARITDRFPRRRLKYSSGGTGSFPHLPAWCSRKAPAPCQGLFPRRPRCRYPSGRRPSQLPPSARPKA